MSSARPADYTPDAHATLERALSEHFGLRLEAYSPPLVKMALSALPEGLDPLDPVVLRQLLTAFAIGETSFLRHPEHFEALERLLPTIPARPPGSPLRVWSAGCATGEEAYSLAATLREVMGEQLDVLGSDLNPASIARAHEGVYRLWSLRGVSLESASEWLDVDALEVRVQRALRERVRFDVRNLVRDPFPPLLHVVFCRNVLLYFDPEAAERVYERMAEVVLPGGLLFTGYGDPEPRSEAWIPCESSGVRYHRRALEPAGQHESAQAKSKVKRISSRRSAAPESPRSRSPEEGGEAARVPAAQPEREEAMALARGLAGQRAFDAALERGCHALEDRLRALESEGGAVVASDELFTALGELEAAFGAGHAAASPPPRERVVEEVPSPIEAQPVADERSARSLELLRVRPERIDLLHDMVGELIVARLQYDAATDRMADAEERLSLGLEACDRLAAELTPLRRLLPEDAYAALRARARLAAESVKEGRRAVAAARRAATVAQAQSAAATSGVDDAARELRLMPLEPFFEGFASAIREAARESGKRARLTIHAHGVEVDRAVLVRLREPLLHLVRNAVVHGLEPGDERERAGKDAVGTVALEARAEGSRALIRVGDDGRGIDEARVREKGAAIGLVDGSSPLSDEALVDVLAHPGLSTREHIDRLAARGVGLNVVADSVRELNGRLHLDTFEGAGCVFTIDVPITASTGGGLVVECAGARLGLLLAGIDRIVRVDPAEIVRVDRRDAVRIDGEPVALVNLAPLIGLEAEPAREGVRRPGIVLRSGSQRIVLQVNDVIGERDLVIKPLGEAFAGADFLLGGAIEADSSVLPVLRVSALFDRAAARPASPSVSREASKTVRPRGALEVLVVDDSITMRTLERNILRAAGYEVRVAHDGVAALEDIRENGAPSLVITDLEMPRMDGCGLCDAIRSSAHPDTPIMVVTSVGRDTEKARALAAGADAYIVKGDFDQGRFLELVDHLTGAVGTAA